MTQQNDQCVPSVGGIAHPVPNVVTGEDQADQYHNRNGDGHGVPGQIAGLDEKGDTDHASAQKTAGEQLPKRRSGNGERPAGVQIADEHAESTDEQKPPAAAGTDINAEQSGQTIQAQRQAHHKLGGSTVVYDGAANADRIFGV